MWARHGAERTGVTKNLLVSMTADAASAAFESAGNNSDAADLIAGPTADWP